MARSKVREVSRPSALQAVSAPVNSYVRPPDPPSSSLNQLAEGLAAFDSGFGSFMEKRKAKTEDADKQRAIKDAYQANGDGFDQGTKTGAIPVHESPSYMKWYKTTQGDVQGRKLRDKFAIAYQTWDGRNGGDPEAYQKFVGQFLSENVGDATDPEVLAGLNPHIEALSNEGYSQFTTDRAATIKKGALSTSGALITDTIERAEEEGRANGEVDYDALWASILPVREEALKRNNAAEYDDNLVESIILAAEESGSTDMLDLLERKLPGQDHPISYDVEVRKKRDAAVDRIRSGQAQMATTKAQAEEKQDKERHNSLVASELTKIHDDPNYVIPEETIKELSRRDPDFRTKVSGFRKAMVGDGLPEDPAAILEVYSQIDGGRGADYVDQMRTQGVIKDPETYTKMKDRVERLKNADKSGGIFDSPTYKDSIKRITNAAGVGEFSFMDGVKGITDEGAAAIFDYRTALLQWETDNPDLAKNAMAKEKAAMEIATQVLGRITPADQNGDDKAKYDDPDAQKAVEPAAAPEAAPGTDPEAKSIPDPYAAPKDRESAVKALSEKYDMTPEEADKFLLEEEAVDDPIEQPTEEDQGLLGRMTNPLRAFLPTNPFKSAMDVANTLMGRKPEPAVGPDDRGTIPEADRTKLQTLLSNPPKLEDGTSSAGNTPVAPLLNLLGKTEGTDRGDGYNETLAYGAFTKGDVDLQNMTLDEVDQLQTEMLRHPSNTMNSSAVGRYQVIRTTLRGLRREMGLGGDEKYDKAMQDRIAMFLLERRGLSRWQAGKLSDAAFMDSLAKEWASLPTRTGKGAYGGQRAAVGVSGMLDTLGKVRKT